MQPETTKNDGQKSKHLSLQTMQEGIREKVRSLHGSQIVGLCGSGFIAFWGVFGETIRKDAVNSHNLRFMALVAVCGWFWQVFKPNGKQNE